MHMRAWVGVVLALAVLSQCTPGYSTDVNDSFIVDKLKQFVDSVKDNPELRAKYTVNKGAVKNQLGEQPKKPADAKTFGAGALHDFHRIDRGTGEVAIHADGDRVYVDVAHTAMPVDPEELEHGVVKAMASDDDSSSSGSGDAWNISSVLYNNPGVVALLVLIILTVITIPTLLLIYAYKRRIDR